jgi:hypothetical protein
MGETLKWVSKYDSIFGSGELYFSTHNPTLFKRGSRIGPKIEKTWPKNHTSSLAIKTMSETLKWVSKYDSIFGSKELFFSTHNPTSFKLGPITGCRVGKKRPKNHTSSLTIKTTCAMLKWVSKYDSIFGSGELCFSTNNPTLFKRGPRTRHGVEKKRPKNHTSSLAIKTTHATQKWVSKYDSIFGRGELFFSTNNPTPFKRGPRTGHGVEKNIPKNHMSSLAIKTTGATLKWASKYDSIFGSRELFFSTHNPTPFKCGHRMGHEVRKKDAQEPHVFARTMGATLKLESNYDSIFLSGEL